MIFLFFLKIFLPISKVLLLALALLSVSFCFNPFLLLLFAFFLFQKHFLLLERSFLQVFL